VLREKEHIAAISTDGRVLILEQLRYLDEIRSPRDLDVPEKSGYTDREMQMALALIDSLSKTFDPRDYKDTYTHELRKLINEKARGKKIRPREHEPVEATDVSEILETLKKSLERLPAQIK
jgi:DNA end-binding protein Ku